MEAPRLWQKMATHILANVEEEWMKKDAAFSWTSGGEGVHQICGFIWADNFWIMSHSKENVKHMLRDLIEQPSRWDLEPKPASLWWTRTNDSEEKSDMNLGTTSGFHTFSFEDTFKMLSCALCRQGKTNDAVEERMQSANKTFWKDILIYKSKDIPWKIKCQRLVDHVCAVFAFGVKYWSWTIHNDGQNQRIGNQDSDTFVQFQRHKEETWVDYHARTFEVARKIWIQMGLPFL